MNTLEWIDSWSKFEILAVGFVLGMYLTAFMNFWLGLLGWN